VQSCLEFELEMAGSRLILISCNQGVREKREVAGGGEDIATLDRINNV